MYKLVAIDLDGTLLNSHSEISDVNKKSLRKLKQNGTEIMLASGRMLESVINYSDEIGKLNYVIASNGAILYDLNKEEIIYENILSKEKVLQIIKICEENSIYYSIYTTTDLITKGIEHNVMVYQNENLIKPEGKRISIIVVQDVYTYIKFLERDDYAKICICDEDKEVFTSIMRKLRAIPNIDVLDVAHLSRKTIKVGTEILPVEYFYTEITNENVNKWNAIQYLIGKININKDEVICIGDNVNDKEMIENAGLGVAMGNSAPYIKEIANYVTLDNNSDGVAAALQFGQFFPH